MRVKIARDYRSTYTLEQLDQAKAVIAWEKENDDETAAGWATYAANLALKDTGDYFREIIKAEAATALNCRAWNAYGDDTGYMDVWIEALAETSDGFIKVGAYLSDIWQTGAVDYREHMYIQRYVKA